MTKEQAIQEQMDQIMDSFEFGKVASIMQHLDWKWASTNGIPDECELRKEARRLMKDAVECGGWAGTGGFTAIFTDNKSERWIRLNLYFGISDMNDGAEYEKNLK